MSRRLGSASTVYRNFHESCDNASVNRVFLVAPAARPMRQYLGSPLRCRSEPTHSPSPRKPPGAAAGMAISPDPQFGSSSRSIALPARPVFHSGPVPIGAGDRREGSPACRKAASPRERACDRRSEAGRHHAGPDATAAAWFGRRRSTAGRGLRAAGPGATAALPTVPSPERRGRPG